LWFNRSDHVEAELCPSSAANSVRFLSRQAKAKLPAGFVPPDPLEVCSKSNGGLSRMRTIDAPLGRKFIQEN
jgi:hypothetical protein